MNHSLGERKRRQGKLQLPRDRLIKSGIARIFGRRNEGCLRVRAGDQLKLAVETLILFEEYLNTSHDPDVEYVDGVLVERNVGLGCTAWSRVT